MNRTYSFIIPCFNSAPTIAQAIYSIQQQSFLGTIEIIVVNNNSTDETSLIASSLGIKVVSEKQPGAAAARNRGAEVTSGTHLIFIDSDVEIGQDWLRDVDQTYQNTPWLDGVAGNIIPTATTPSLLLDFRWYLLNLRSLGYMNLLAAVTPTTNSALFSIKRSSFNLLGGFTGALQRLEDTDFGFRAFHASMNFGATSSPALVYYSENSLWRYFLRSFKLGLWIPSVFPLDTPFSFLKIQHHYRPLMELLSVINNIFSMSGYFIGIWLHKRKKPDYLRSPGRNSFYFRFKIENQEHALNSYLSLIRLPDKIVALDGVNPIYEFRGQELEIFLKTQGLRASWSDGEIGILERWVGGKLFIRV